MQLQLPFFPEHTRYINSTLGLFEKEGYVYYLHNGSPIYCHLKEDRNSYRFIVGNLICNKLCTIFIVIELIKAPKPCIEYVIIHELCHLIHRDHTKAFFELLKTEMPDWERWKKKLEMMI